MLLASFVVWKIMPEFSLLGMLPFSFWLWMLFAALVSFPLGWILGGVIAWPFLAVIAGKLNGAPFHESETVRILRGPYRDRVVNIYELWPSRQQVRVWLDEQHKKNVTDVFSYHEVCRDVKIDLNTQ